MQKKFYFPNELLWLSALAIILNLLRVLIFQSTYFLYLLFNIALSTLPFLVSSLIYYFYQHNKLDTTKKILLGILWLLLLPNAPYIVTDIVHVTRTHGGLPIYDTFLLFACAWVGLLFGFYSILYIEKILRSKYSNKQVSIAVASVILFSSFGIYLGRFLRFNSWDILVNPIFFFKNLFEIFSHPTIYLDVYLFTGVSFIFTSLAYIAWKSGKKVI